jgi:MFS family permease
MPSTPARSASVPAAVVIVCGCLIAVLTFGPRSTMGFFLTPMTTEQGWSREAFAFAIALQNLLWGIGQPFAGMIADRFGTWRVLSSGAVLYALGLVLMAYASDETTLAFTAGVMVGLGIAGSAFFMVLAAFARLLPESFRSTAYGFGSAAGSLGQLLFAPIGLGAIDLFGYQATLLMLAGSLAIVPLLAIPLKGRPAPGGAWAAATRPSPTRSARRFATAPICFWWQAFSSAASTSRSSPSTCRRTSSTRASIRPGERWRSE